MPISHRQEQLRELESKLNTRFSSDELIDQALTHSSYVNETKKAGLLDNERLEFLGDAVLKLIISEYLFKSFPEKAEGDLTKIRAAVVSDLSLSDIARQIDIGKYLMLGKNEKNSGGDRKKSNLANALESIIASIYLSSGFEEAKKVVIGLLKGAIENASSEGFMIDYKSALQELCQKNRWGLPFYKVAKELGPKHKRVFLIEVKIKGARHGSGRGLSKKEAEQNAAKQTLEKINSGDPKNKGISDMFFGMLSKRRPEK